MAEASQGPHLGGLFDNPPGSTIGTLVPSWLLSNDEIGYQIVLVMQVRRELDSGEKEINHRLPSPIVIGLSVEQVIGAEKAKEIVASKEGRGTKYLLRTNSRLTAEKLLTIKNLVDGTLVEVVPHSTLNSVEGVVYEPDSINDDEEKILDYLKCQGVTKVRRIRKRVNGTLRNTPLLVLSLKGAVLPQFIYFGLLRVPMRTYYPSPLLCYNCGIYGHPKKACKEASICLHCSQEVHISDGEQCQNPAFCLHCKANHPIHSRECPKYQQEAKIIKHKTDNRISFGEARRELRDRCGDTYASALQQRLHQVESEKDTIIANLRKELEAVKAELKTLKETSLSNHPNGEIEIQNVVQSSTPTVKGVDMATKDTNSQMPSSSDSGTMTGTRTSVNATTGRKSRKDKLSMSPPKESSHSTNNRLLHNMELRNRSRSDKRINTSPPDRNREKRRHLDYNDGR